jgi:chromosome segregation ATPase
MPTPTEKNTQNLVQLTTQFDQAMDRIIKAEEAVETLKFQSIRLERDLAHANSQLEKLRSEFTTLVDKLNGLASTTSSLASRIESDKEHIQHIWRWIYGLVFVFISAAMTMLVALIRK